jgi:hypothetical protein
LKCTMTLSLSFLLVAATTTFGVCAGIGLGPKGMRLEPNVIWRITKMTIEEKLKEKNT